MQHQQQTATRLLFTEQPQSHAASSGATATQRSDGNRLSRLPVDAAVPTNHTALVEVPAPETAAGADTAAVAAKTAAAHVLAHAAAAAVAEATAAEEEAAAAVVLLTRAPAETTAAAGAAVGKGGGEEKGGQSSNKAAADITNQTRALNVSDRVCVDEVSTTAACSVSLCEEPDKRVFKALGGVAAPQLTGSNFNDSKITQRVRRATEMLEAETADEHTNSVTPGTATAAAVLALDHSTTITTRATTAATAGGGASPSSYSHSSSATTTTDDAGGGAAAACRVGMRELNGERRGQHEGCYAAVGSERTEGQKKKQEKLRDLEAREHRETLKESIVGYLETRDDREGLKDSEMEGKENGERDRKKRKEETVATGDDIITQKGRRQDGAEENEETDPIEYEELVYLTFPELSMSSVFTPTTGLAAAASEKEEVRKAALRVEESLPCSHVETAVTAKTGASAKFTQSADAETRDNTQKTREEGGDKRLLHDTSVTSTHSVENSTTKEISTPADTIEAAIHTLWQSHCEERSAVSTITSTNNTTKNAEQREHVFHENDARKKEEHGEGRRRSAPPVSQHTVNCQDSHEAATTSDEHTGNSPESNEAATDCSSGGGAGLTSCRMQLFDIDSEKPLALINESLSFVGRTSRLDALETLLFLRCDQQEQQQQRAEQTQGHMHQRNNDDCHEKFEERRRRWHHNNAVNRTRSRNFEKPFFAEGLTRHKIEFVVDAGAAAAQRAGAALRQPAPLP